MAVSSNTISGVFEPFAEYVRLQLNIRKTILANPVGAAIDYAFYNSDGEKIDNNIFGNLVNEGFKPDQNISKTSPIPYQMDSQGRIKATVFQKGEGFQTGTRFLPEEYFFTYAVEKQCTIRMMSGVDLKPQEFLTEGLLEEGYEDKKLQGSGLAKQYILESGTQFYNSGGAHGGLREGFTEGELQDETRGFSYGDKNIRSNPDDDFGAVPMPGIVDAEIRTKSDDGALREAKVNFVCHNRRQLEVLELLYMRPGYPVCLEWGWSPYISNFGEREQNDFTIKDDFMSGKKTMNQLNDEIRYYKRLSGGNYDGFIGFVKNFEFKAREDGGYDCVSDIIAHGEILESLKFSKMAVENNKSVSDFYRNYQKYEFIDKFLYYLRSLKYNLDKEGDQYFYSNFHKELLRDSADCANNHPSDPKQYWVNTQKFTNLRENGTTDKYDGFLCMYNKGELYFYTERRDENITIPTSAYFAVYKNEIRANNDNPGTDRDPGESIQNESTTYNPFHRRELNKTHQIYKEGFNDIVQLYSFIAKVPYGDVKSSLINMGIGRGFDFNAQDGENPMRHIDRRDAAEAGIGYEAETLEERYGYDYNAEYWDSNAGVGFQSMLGGTILKQISRVRDISAADSGYQKDVFIRWDMICQIMNHLSTSNPVGFKESLEKITHFDASIQPEYQYALHGAMNPLGAGISYTSNFYENQDPNNYTEGILIEGLSGRFSIDYYSDLGGGSEVDYKTIIQDYTIINRLAEPLVEMTYINPGAETWSNSAPNKGQTPWSGRYFYLPYGAPKKRQTDPPRPANLESERIKTNQTTTTINDVEQTQEIVLDMPSSAPGGDSDGSIIEEHDGYHDLIGHSYDPSICIMPHSPVLDSLYNEGRFYFDTDITDRGYMTWETIQREADEVNMKIAEGEFEVEYGTGGFPEYYNEYAYRYFRQINDDRAAGRSVAGSINPLTTGFGPFVSYEPWNPSDNNLKSTDWNGIDDTGTVYVQQQIEELEGNLTNGSTQRNSIGLIYLNLNFLIDTYESMRLKKVTSKSDDSDSYVTLDTSFNMFDYIKAVWDGVNASCGHVYDFRIHSEHEKPSKIRILDFKVQGQPSDWIYTFEPQGLRSITRDFYFDSKISSDMSSAISIAAQAPSLASDLEALSFRAFHRDIQSRFTSKEFLEAEHQAEKDLLKSQLERDLQRVSEIYESLWVFMGKLNSSNWVRYNKAHSAYKMTPDKAAAMVTELPGLLTSIRSRYPLVNLDKQPHPKAGQYRPGTTNESSAIIPLQFNIKLDGIAGILPLQIFKVQKERLPKAYQRDDIVFVVKSEVHKITSTQDWTVDITGQMALIDSNANLEGFNPTEEFEDISVITNTEPDKEDWINPYPGEFEKTSDWPTRFKRQWNTLLKKYHAGLDLGIPCGTPLLAPRDCKVIRTQGMDGYGFVIVVEFDEEFIDLLHEDAVRMPWSNNVYEDFGQMKVSKEDEYSFAISARLNFPADMTVRDSNGNPTQGVKRALFAHLGSMDVKVGDRIKQGEKLGTTGKSNKHDGTNVRGACHLHYELGTEDAFGSGWFDRSSSVYTDFSSYKNPDNTVPMGISGTQKQFWRRKHKNHRWREVKPTDNNGNPIPDDELDTIKETSDEAKARRSQSVKLIRIKKALFDPKRFINYPDNF